MNEERPFRLESLLADLAAQRVTIMREPSRPDRFSAAEGRFIREIVVQKVEAEAYGR